MFEERPRLHPAETNMTGFNIKVDSVSDQVKARGGVWKSVGSARTSTEDAIQLHSGTRRNEKAV